MRIVLLYRFRLVLVVSTRMVESGRYRELYRICESGTGFGTA
jgi:hypothetical protein